MQKTTYFYLNIKSTYLLQAANASTKKRVNKTDRQHVVKTERTDLRLYHFIIRERQREKCRNPQIGKRSRYKESYLHKPASLSPMPCQQVISNISQRLSYTTCQSNPSSRAIIKHSTFGRPPHTAPPSHPHPPPPPTHAKHIFRYTRFSLFICVQYVPHEFALPQVESEKCGMWKVESGKPYSSVSLRSAS